MRAQLSKILLVVSMLLCYPFLFAQIKTIEKPLAKQGVLDLRNAHLSKTVVDLHGEWEFFWKKLIDPKNSSAIRTAMVEFPVTWGKTKLDNQYLPNVGYASYRLLVLLPEKGMNLALKMPDTYASCRIYVNGELFLSSGNPDSIKATAVPKWLNLIRQLPNDRDSLQILVQIANFWHSKGGPYKNIQIGPEELLVSDAKLSGALDLFLTGCLFMGGLFFLGLFIFGRFDKSILFFALFCIIYSYRMIGSKEYVLHELFPTIPWTITLHLEYLTLFICLGIFSLYTQYLYPKDSILLLTKIQVGFSFLLSLIVILFPASLFTYLIHPFLIFIFAVILYVLYVYIKAWLNKRKGAGYALLSTGVIMIVFLLINLQYFNVYSPPKVLIFLGYLAFFFFQSLILSFRFADEFSTSIKLAQHGLKSKNEFLSTMSHEIRTPLNSILGMTHLILRDNPKPEQKEQLNVLLFSANNLLAIVNDILDYNKIEAGKVHFESIETDLAINLKNIISGAESAATEKGISLKLQIDPLLPKKVLADPTRLSQIISNLVGNAIKFTKKGYVLLSLSVEELSNTTVTFTIRVEDTGIGIAQEKQKIIFEQFTQADTSTSRNFGGTGLGLAICKKLIELQGASLELLSAPEKGSIFYFTLTLPFIVENTFIETPKLNPLPLEDSKALKGISILLVEDNEVNVLVAKAFLERWGANIDVAENGEIALKLIDPNKHKLVLMDMHMPVMDGYTCTKEMRKRGISLPIIALTASVPYEPNLPIHEIGLDCIIAKPFVPEEFYKIILHYAGITNRNF